jgi:hypothetical protein
MVKLAYLLVMDQAAILPIWKSSKSDFKNSEQ